MEYVRFIIAAAAVFGTITGLLVGIYTASRVVMVVSRDWLLPTFLGAINVRTQTPLAATACLGTIVCEPGPGRASTCVGGEGQADGWSHAAARCCRFPFGHLSCVAARQGHAGACVVPPGSAASDTHTRGKQWTPRREPAAGHGPTPHPTRARTQSC